MELPQIYKSRGGLLITLFKEYKDGHLAGYFEIRNIRIRIYYTKNLDEVNGEKQLDLVQRMFTTRDLPLVKGSTDPVV